MHPKSTNDTDEIIKWLTANGTINGVARTKLNATSEGEYLALGVCRRNIKIPPRIFQALDSAIELWTENSVRFSCPIPDAHQRNKEHEEFLDM